MPNGQKGALMSRHLSRRVDVQCDERGVPLSVAFGRTLLPIREVVDDWREWFSPVFGEKERDVWIVDTPRGIYELHHVGFPADTEENKEDAEENKAQAEQDIGHWVIERVED